VLLQIPGVLYSAQIAECRAAFAGANWIDGRATAGYLSSSAKDNNQLLEGDPVACRLGKMILDALDANRCSFRWRFR
jgi:PKHD-type hydroxylase